VFALNFCRAGQLLVWGSNPNQGENVMKSITAVIIALGLATSGAAIAADNTGNAPGGTGVEQSTESMGATDKQGDTSAQGQMQSGPNSTDQGGTGIKGSAEGRGATDKSTEDKTAPMGSTTGMSSGNAPGGTGVEDSSQGKPSTEKN
jgi:hypothetical protein